MWYCHIPMYHEYIILYVLNTQEKNVDLRLKVAKYTGDTKTMIHIYFIVYFYFKL